MSIHGEYRRAHQLIAVSLFRDTLYYPYSEEEADQLPAIENTKPFQRLVERHQQYHLRVFL